MIWPYDPSLSSQSHFRTRLVLFCQGRSPKCSVMMIWALGRRNKEVRGGWGKLAGGVKWPPPPVRHLTKVNEMAMVSGHLSSLEVTRSKISKSCPL